MITRVIDQHLSHYSRGNREEVRLVVKLDAGLVGELEESLMDERGRVQGVAVALVLELSMGHRAQLGVDEWNDPIPGTGIAAVRSGQDVLGDLGLGTHRFTPSARLRRACSRRLAVVRSSRGFRI